MPKSSETMLKTLHPIQYKLLGIAAPKPIDLEIKKLNEIIDHKYETSLGSSMNNCRYKAAIEAAKEFPQCSWHIYDDNGRFMWTLYYGEHFVQAFSVEY
jgi:hypothetical protein